MDTDLLAALALLLLLAALVAAVVVRRLRSAHLVRHFGPEYERTVRDLGSRGRAEAELAARERRVRGFDITPLAAHQSQRFRMEWQALQARFVDSPRTALAEADLLVRDVMARRGYPVADFEHRAADLSVDHPRVVQHYRAAHAIALRDRKDEADTESLRQAVVHYRALFEELLQPASPRRVEERRREPARGAFARPERAMARDQAVARDRERRKER